jgi:hypothetical protein
VFPAVLFVHRARSRAPQGREIEVETPIQVQVRRVRRFSRYARAFCTLTFVFLGLVYLLLVIGVLAGGRGLKVGFGTYTMGTEQLTTIGMKAWAIVFVAVIFGLLFKGLYHLRALFGNFVAGDIYTKETVRHIRNLGWVALAMPLLGGVMVLISWALLKWGFVDEASVTRQTRGLTPASFGSLIAPALILLASWVMDVGRQTQEEAEQLRRDAELVV